VEIAKVVTQAVMKVTYSVFRCCSILYYFPYQNVCCCGSGNEELTITVSYKVRVTTVLELGAKMKTLHSACLTFVLPQVL
jgi:hypothetical protein